LLSNEAPGVNKIDTVITNLLTQVCLNQPEVQVPQVTGAKNNKEFVGISKREHALEEQTADFFILWTIRNPNYQPQLWPCNRYLETATYTKLNVDTKIYRTLFREDKLIKMRGKEKFDMKAL
jgi:hypothetical protein